MKIYNTLSRQKEEFQPQGEVVTIYSCGVTPYAESHLGHAMNAVIFDTVRRYLIFRGYKVKFVQTSPMSRIKSSTGRINWASRRGNWRRSLPAVILKTWQHSM